MAPPTSPGGEPAALYAKHQLAGWLAVETVQTPLCFSHTREMRYAVRARLFATAAPLELKIASISRAPPKNGIAPPAIWI
jgi:hypothetical protein